MYIQYRYSASFFFRTIRATIVVCEAATLIGQGQVMHRTRSFAFFLRKKKQVNCNGSTEQIPIKYYE